MMGQLTSVRETVHQWCVQIDGLKSSYLVQSHLMGVSKDTLSVCDSGSTYYVAGRGWVDEVPEGRLANPQILPSHFGGHIWIGGISSTFGSPWYVNILYIVNVSLFTLFTLV